MPRPRPVADLLADALHGKPAEKRLREGRIWLNWHGAVGPQIAGHAQPISFRDGVLTVAVASAPWMQELNFLKRTIAERLNVLIGEPLVQEIYLKTGKVDPPRPPEPPPPLPLRELIPAERDRVAAEAAAIEDPELRAAFARLMSRHLALTPRR
ncbi:DUF721 domain-containing protein [Geobacter sp.]|uniref:DUF721 domain-containing protein n=1 Tax=Geobacter sp. TaxID=46610 RepID=UPI0026189A3B|nr:DUF721 domain-containing protein [Geobacter sp.]